ncbi:UTRA domain-containing protein [Streptomyces melanosporofaciens]|uniref:UTRA domain-containing protein n=2 Tax=Streptomyces TaxID=1883 RepID=A0A1H5A6Y4_STRMJ|nr:UTRA domain-containing protein [Streptomyces melanosporofaciens]
MLPELDAAVHAVESLDTILRQMCGVTPVRAWCRVSSVLPDRRVAEGLETAHNRPVWLVESLSRDAASGRAVMLHLVPPGQRPDHRRARRPGHPLRPSRFRRWT